MLSRWLSGVGLGTGRGAQRRGIRPACEALERREVFSGSTVAGGLHAAGIEHLHRRVGVHRVIGTISGTVTNGANHHGLAGVHVQLIDAQGDVVQSRVTDGRGRYSFRIFANGAYVVREVTPRRFTQTSPSFSTTRPTGSYATNPATGQPYGGSSYSYATGNSDPANGPVGPYAWDAVAPAADLPFQSPIDLDVSPIDLRSYLSIHYGTSTPSALVNNGHQLQVQFSEEDAADTITVGDEPYHLAQFHFHDPSEHTVQDHGYAMEAHFVNESASGAESVVGVFLQLGAHNNALDPILRAATERLRSPGSSTTDVSPVDLSGLLPTSLEGWFYQGSLTTPPLSQVVNWFVLSTPITLDENQLREYEALAGGSGFLPNNRPIQPLDGRQINEFTYNVNFQGQSIAGLNFTNARARSPASSTTPRHGPPP